MLRPRELLAEIDTDDPAMMQKLVEETLYSQTRLRGNFHEITRSLDATSGCNELVKLTGAPSRMTLILRGGVSREPPRLYQSHRAT